MSPNFASDITYTKNYSSFICNSNSVGTPAVCVAVPSLNNTVSANKWSWGGGYVFLCTDGGEGQDGWVDGWMVNRCSCRRGSVLPRDSRCFQDDHLRRVGLHEGEVQCLSSAGSLGEASLQKRQGGTHCPLLLSPSCSSESHPVWGLPHWNQL